MRTEFVITEHPDGDTRLIHHPHPDSDDNTACHVMYIDAGDNLGDIDCAVATHTCDEEDA